MDSPEREPYVPVASFQESPLYNYLCTLSPLGPFAPARIPQTYTELRVPPAPVVFVSPPGNSRKCVRGIKSCDDSMALFVSVEQGLLGDAWEVHQRERNYEQFLARTDYQSASSVLNCEICSGIEDGYYCELHYSNANVNQENICTCNAFKDDTLFFGNTKEVDSRFQEAFRQPELLDIGEELFCLPYLENVGIQEAEEETCPSIIMDQLPTRSLTAQCIKDSTPNAEQNSTQLCVTHELMKAQSTVGTDLPDKEAPQEREQGVAIMKFRVIKPRTRLAKYAALEDDKSEKTRGHKTVQCVADQSAFRSSYSKQNMPMCQGNGYGVEQVILSLPNHLNHEDDGTTELMMVQEERERSDRKTLSCSGTMSNITCKIRADKDLGTDKSSKEHYLGGHGVRRKCLDFEVPAAKRSRSNSEIIATMPRISRKNSLSSFKKIVSSSSLIQIPAAGTNANDNTQCLTADLSISCLLPGKELHTGDNPTQFSLNMCNSPMLVNMQATGTGLQPQNLNDINALLAAQKNFFPFTECVPVLATKDSCSETVGESLLSDDYNSMDPILYSDGDCIYTLLENSAVNNSRNLAGFESQIRAIASLSGFQPDTMPDDQAEAAKSGSLEDHQLSSCQNGMHLEKNMGESLESPNKSKIGRVGDKDGGRYCKCKKSRCLKLYCECFAAGNYCVDSCSCRECFNKLKYETTVLGTRQQIETRNPTAFAPKIVRATESSFNDQEDSVITPASGRHKRGCSCRRSRCLKKYCECYQAGVGCSEGCRCEGCKNMFGLK